LAVFNVVAVAFAEAMGDLFNNINRMMVFFFFFFWVGGGLVCNFGCEMDDCFMAHFWIYLLEAEFNMQVIANLGNEMFRELRQCDFFFHSTFISINIHALYTFYS
jgi:hypothetical protein